MNKRLFYNVLVIFLFSIAIRIIPSSLNLMTEDSCTYLDIARNIAEGRGFQVSYNLYQFWSGKFYSALVYAPPVFPILLAVIWKLFHCVAAAILLNVLISAINASAFYLILENVYKNAKVSFWSAIFASICAPMFLTSINVWAEQLHLLFLLIIVYICLKDLSLKNTRYFLIGLLFGFSFLVKASVWNLSSFLIFTFLNFKRDKKVLRAAGYLAFGFLIILLPYQLLCLLKFDALYPQYFKANTIGYLKSIMVGGYYQMDNIPVLTAHKASLGFLLAFFSKMIPLWLLRAVENISIILGILFYFLFLRLLLPLPEENKDIKVKENLFIVLALVNFFAQALTIYWHPWLNTMEVLRLNLITYIFLIPVAVRYLYGLLGHLSIKPESYSSKIYTIALLFVLASMTRYVSFYYGDLASYREKNILRRKAFAWIQKNSGPSELIATSEAQDGFELFRPLVSLPKGKVLTKLNMNNFLLIYKPTYILLSDDLVKEYSDFLSGSANKIALKEDWEKLYSIYSLK